MTTAAISGTDTFSRVEQEPGYSTWDPYDYVFDRASQTWFRDGQPYPGSPPVPVYANPIFQPSITMRSQGTVRITIVWVGMGPAPESVRFVVEGIAAASKRAGIVGSFEASDAFGDPAQFEYDAEMDSVYSTGKHLRTAKLVGNVATYDAHQAAEASSTGPGAAVWASARSVSALFDTRKLLLVPTLHGSQNKRAGGRLPVDVTYVIQGHSPPHDHPHVHTYYPAEQVVNDLEYTSTETNTRRIDLGVSKYQKRWIGGSGNVIVVGDYLFFVPLTALSHFPRAAFFQSHGFGQYNGWNRPGFSGDLLPDEIVTVPIEEWGAAGFDNVDNYDGAWQSEMRQDVDQDEHPVSFQVAWADGVVGKSELRIVPHFPAEIQPFASPEYYIYCDLLPTYALYPVPGNNVLPGGWIRGPVNVHDFFHMPPNWISLVAATWPTGSGTFGGDLISAGLVSKHPYIAAGAATVGSLLDFIVPQLGQTIAARNKVGDLREDGTTPDIVNLSQFDLLYYMQNPDMFKWQMSVRPVLITTGYTEDRYSSTGFTGSTLRIQNAMNPLVSAHKVLTIDLEVQQ